MMTQDQIAAREKAITVRVHELEDLCEADQQEILQQIALTDPYTAGRIADILKNRQSIQSVEG